MIKKLWSRLSALRADERGNILLIAAASLPVVIGFAGLGTDTIQWTLSQRQMQRAADSAALSGAFARAQGKNVTTSATADLTRNLDFATSATAQIENAPTSGAYAGKTSAVRVILQHSHALPFSSLFISTPPTLTVRATAAVLQNGDYCMISLEDTAAVGISFSGNPTVNMGCGIVSNSIAANAVDAGGSSQITATPVAAVGGITPAPNNYVAPTELIPYTVPQRDPYANLPDPAPTGCKNNDVGTKDKVTLAAGSCSNGLDVKGELVLEPGVHYINGSSFKVNAGAKITGVGVTIILTGTSSSDIASLAWNGGANLNLTAPDSGTYNGVLIYKDRRSPSSTVDKINGGANMNLEGAIYMPSQTLEYTGNSGVASTCLKIVSRKIVFSGNTTIDNHCPPDPNEQSFKGTQVRLVE